MPLNRLHLALIAALASAALVTATAGQANALTFGTRSFTCPIDGKTFTARVPLSGTSFGMRLDTRRIGPIASPWPMPVCPGSGFPLYKRRFSEAEAARLKAIVATPAYKAVRAGNTNYYVAAWVRAKLGAKPYRLALYYLRASWEAERGDPARHRRYLNITLNHFRGHLKGTDLKSRRDQAASIFAANLERRLGRFDAARTRIRVLLPHLKKAALRQVVMQIDRWAAKANAEPQKYLPPQKTPKKTR